MPPRERFVSVVGGLDSSVFLWGVGVMSIKPEVGLGLWVLGNWALKSVNITCIERFRFLRSEL